MAWQVSGMVVFGPCTLAWQVFHPAGPPNTAAGKRIMAVGRASTRRASRSFHWVFFLAFPWMTSSPAYVPHVGHTVCANFKVWHLEHGCMAEGRAAR